MTTRRRSLDRGKQEEQSSLKGNGLSYAMMLTVGSVHLQSYRDLTVGKPPEPAHDAFFEITPLNKSGRRISVKLVLFMEAAHICSQSLR